MQPTHPMTIASPSILGHTPLSAVADTALGSTALGSTVLGSTPLGPTPLQAYDATPTENIDEPLYWHSALLLIINNHHKRLMHWWRLRDETLAAA
jgi:hypothetical protein